LFKRNDFSTGFTSFFKKPIANIVDKKVSDIPGPKYDTEKANRLLFHSNNVSADAAFKSQTKRGGIPSTGLDNPAPGTYEPNDNLTHISSKVPYSSFKSTSKRNAFSYSLDNPGPGEYSPDEPIQDQINRQLFPRLHYLAISAPAVAMPAELPTPGPGAYELRQKEIEKRYMTSAAFVSSTGRWNSISLKNATLPGPAKYSPEKMIKHSFNYNYDKKWL
jgi:hypothetical protein